MASAVQVRSPEVQFVLACLQSRSSPASEQAVAVEAAVTAAADVDPEAVLSLLQRHAVTPLVHEAIHPFRGRLLPVLVEAIDARVRTIRIETLDTVGELMRLLTVFEAEGIQAVPYKGPMTAERLYGNIGLREFVDLDVLMSPSDVERASALMAGAGYRSVVDISRRQLRMLLRTGHDRKFVRDSYVVEIQWALAARSEGIPADLAPLLRRATPLRLGGRDIPTLAPLDEVLVLSLHGSLHLWARLGWITDVAEAISPPRLSHRDACMLVRAATRAGVRRRFLSGPAVAKAVLGAELPSPIEDEIRADPTFDQWIPQIVDLLLAPNGPTYPSARDHLRLGLALADDPVRRVRQAFRALATPTVSDWHAIPLPDSLWPLYVPLRLVRLMASYAVGNRTPGDWLRDEFGH